MYLDTYYGLVKFTIPALCKPLQLREYLRLRRPLGEM